MTKISTLATQSTVYAPSLLVSWLHSASPSGTSSFQQSGWARIDQTRINGNDSQWQWNCRNLLTKQLLLKVGAISHTNHMVIYVTWSYILKNHMIINITRQYTTPKSNDQYQLHNCIVLLVRVQVSIGILSNAA